MFKNINIRLLIALISMMVFPSLYQTVRVNFLGDLPSDAGINIASQILWLSLIYEIAQEALILPLFYLFGKSLSDKNELLEDAGGCMTSGIRAIANPRGY